MRTALTDVELFGHAMGLGLFGHGLGAKEAFLDHARGFGRVSDTSDSLRSDILQRLSNFLGSVSDPMLMCILTLMPDLIWHRGMHGPRKTPNS